MVKGAVDYLKIGLSIPKVVLDESKEYLESEDELGEFIESKLKKEKGRRI